MTINDTTSPTSTQFTDWITLADGVINEYLHVTANVTDINTTAREVAGRLLYRKYLVWRATASNDPAQIAAVLTSLTALGITDPMELTDMEQTKLNTFTAKAGNRRTSYVFNWQTGERVY